MKADEHERFVLDQVYTHAASYQTAADGSRVFSRLTNLSRVEVLLPEGYEAASTEPAGAMIAESEGRCQVRWLEIGPKTIRVSMKPAAR